jgi:CBS domain-containing protein
MLDPIERILPCRQQVELVSALAGLNKLDAAPELACRMRGFLQDMAGRGLSGFAMTRLISAFNDQLTTRLIELVASNYHLPPVDWCWLALGSEGRHEQTFVTDQDNGLIFNALDGREAAAMRAVFLPFAQEVNQRLADCGFKLCAGGIMAGNPDWCLSLDEWRSRFIDWVRRPEPAALLNASIFFDLRPLYGQLGLGEALRTLLLGMTRETTSFLHLMAANALQAEAPLTFRGEVQVDDSGFLDLKKYGSRIFVDAARIFALATGGTSVNSAERLHASAATVGLLAAESAAVDAAFSHMLRLRLAQQLTDQAAGTEAGYRLKFTDLNEMDRVILRESLKQARRLQLRLKLNYAL